MKQRMQSVCTMLFIARVLIDYIFESPKFILQTRMDLNKVAACGCVAAPRQTFAEVESGMPGRIG
jgi:hypothetical protein